MYTETNKGFTIITNFGCDNRCSYCITRYHPILNGNITDKSKIDWNKLDTAIKNTKAPIIDLSGGGDPFYHWQDNIDFFDKVF